MKNTIVENQSSETVDEETKPIKPDFSAWMTSPKIRSIIVWAGILGMGLILLSALFGSGAKEEQTAAQETSSDYATVMETKLHDLLICVEGVTECRVLITLENGSRYVYANNGKEPLTECEPTVRGVVVVVDGVVSKEAETEIKSVVKTALHLAEKRVCVVANTIET